MPASQRTISNQVLVTAFQRGVPAPQLARATGVSVQRIYQILKRYGITVGRHNQPRRTGRVAWACQFCKRIEWAVPSEADHRRYCSLKCSAQGRGKSNRRVPERDVLRAIELRQAGYTWQQIQQERGWPYQTLARWIWRLLAERGELTEAKAVELLQDTRGRLKVRWARAGWSDQTRALVSHIDCARQNAAGEVTLVVHGDDPSV